MFEISLQHKFLKIFTDLFVFVSNSLRKWQRKLISIYQTSVIALRLQSVRSNIDSLVVKELHAQPRCLIIPSELGTLLCVYLIDTYHDNSSTIKEHVDGYIK